MTIAGWIILGALLASLAVSGVAYSTGSRPAVGFQVDIGAFTVVAERHRISASGFPNSTMNPFRTIPVHRFTLRHEGRPLGLPSAGRPGAATSSFNMVYHLPDAPHAALLVPAGLGVQLIDHGGNGLRMQALPVMDQPVALLQWLDAAAGQPEAPQGPRLGEHVPSDLRLQGGRWLLVNRTVVLDVQSLQYHPVRPWIPQGSDRPMAGLNASTEPALAFSPRGNQYVALASGADAAPDGWDRALLVVDIPTGNPYGVAIPPRHRAEVEAGRVDGAWIRRYFAWRDQGSVERLVYVGDMEASDDIGA